MRLLLITAWYHPFIHPRAHRWTALAEHWAAQGHEVHVVCARRRDCPDTAVLNGVRLHRTGFDSLREWVYFTLGMSGGRGRVGQAPVAPGTGMRLFARLYRSVWKNICFPDDAGLWYFPARRKARALLSEQPFDRVITVSLPFTGHLIGLSLRKRYPDLHWVADIGDPFTIQPRPLNNAFLYGRWSRQLEARVLQRASATVVTHTGAKRAYEQAFGPQTRMAVLPPLLYPFPIGIPDPSAALPVFDRTPGCLHLGYFGAFYAPTRTPDALLALLDRTRAADPALGERLRVHLFGEIFPEFWDALGGHPNIRLYGLRSREEVRSAMAQVDVLVHPGNTTDYQLPSKAVEYLASGKPVLHLSYLAGPDPFIEFWGEQEGLWIVQIETGGNVTETAFQSWKSALEQAPGAGPYDRSGVLEAFSVERLSAGYLL